MNVVSRVCHPADRCSFQLRRERGFRRRRGERVFAVTSCYLSPFRRLLLVSGSEVSRLRVFALFLQQLAPEVLGALKSASTDTTASPPATASVSPDAQDSDDDDDDDDEDDSEESVSKKLRLENVRFVSRRSQNCQINTIKFV